MKQQTKIVSPWKLGALSALCALLIAVFACSEDPGKDASDVNNSLDASGKEKIFMVVEAQPEFEGGLDAFHNYIRKEIRYPLEARQKGIEGRVDVEFVVGKDGAVEVTGTSGIGAGCDVEAARVMQTAPRFKPGTQNGKPVNVRMLVPITFKLDEGKKNPDNTAQGIIIIENVQSINEKFKVDAHYANGAWSGTVYDEQGEELPGVNIVIVGTTTGTTSNIDGTFKIKADESTELNFSFIGYESLRLKGKRNN